MMMRLFIPVVAIACTTAYSPSVSRRQAFQTFVAGTLIGSQAPTVAFALDICNPTAHNCVFTIWTPPSGTSKSNAIKDLLSVIEAYPQQGQSVSWFVQSVVVKLTTTCILNEIALTLATKGC
jgi:hypothetical protein